MNLRFYSCELCGKVITILSGAGVPTVCCGKPMKELPMNRVDGAIEKHVPVDHIEGNRVRVQVGSDLHPMTETHSILWIGIRTAQGFQFKELHPGDAPEACFQLCDGDRVEAVYAYCNLHGLWCA